MSNNKINKAVAAVMSLGIAYSGAVSAEEQSSGTDMMPGIEKCYGVAKKGMNDCSTANHHCAGEAKIDGAKDEWLAMPNALCKRIVGGSTEKS